MNKLDALIADLKPEMQLGPVYPLANASAIRRILEAVREDMGESDIACEYKRDKSMCPKEPPCWDCPREEHSAVRAALED